MFWLRFPRAEVVHALNGSFRLPCCQLQVLPTAPREKVPHQPAAAHFPVLPARTPHKPTSSLTIPRYHSWPPRFCQGLHRETSHPGVVCWTTCPTRALLVVGLLTLTPCSIPRLGFPNRYDIGLFRWSDIAARSFFALTFSCRAALSPNPYVPRLSLDRVV
jgi:hypothetical protein